jgi:hypothetical protein
VRALHWQKMCGLTLTLAAKWSDRDALTSRILSVIVTVQTLQRPKQAANTSPDSPCFSQFLKRNMWSRITALL